MWGMEKKTVSDNEDGKKGVWGSQFDQAVADARKGGVGAKKKSQGNASGGESAGGGVRLSGETAEKIKAMFEPDAWRAIVRAPFALGKAMTGRKCWELEKNQEDTLATSTSGTAEYFLTTEPKYVMLTLFLFNWSVVLTDKMIQNAAERKKEEALNPPQVEPTKMPGVSIVKP